MMLRHLLLVAGIFYCLFFWEATKGLQAFTDDDADCWKHCGAVCNDTTGSRTGCGVLNPCKVVQCTIGWADSDPGDPNQICDESAPGHQYDRNDDCNHWVDCDQQLEGCGEGWGWPPPI